MCPRRSGLYFEQINQLIKLVKDNPCIWNPNDDNYNDRNITAETWTNIAKELQLSEMMIRGKWKNLRDLFIRELKRLYGTDIEDYMGKWKYFRKLWFLYRPDNQDKEVGEEESSDEPVEVKMEPGPVNECLFLQQESECEKAISNLTTDPVDVSDAFQEEPLPKRRRLERYSDEDCDMMFLKSLMPYFKLLLPIRKLVVRNKIQEMLLKEVAPGNSSGQL